MIVSSIQQLNFLITSFYYSYYSNQELSEVDHNLNGHNAEYDHEAFLGRERAHDFDTSSPEESKDKLG